MSEIAIVIPSHLRADSVFTAKTALPPEMCNIVVPESQVAEYMEHNPDSPIIGHPDEIRGLPKKRSWIAEKFGDHMQVDDDQTHFIHCEHSLGDKECRMDPWDAYWMIQRIANDARDAGCFLFSMNPSPDVRNFAPQSPFLRTGYICGGALGWLTGSKLWINERIVAKDDYWLAALNAHFYRNVWVDLRYTSKGAKDFTTKGGTAAVRTQETERRDNKILIETFGSDVFLPKARTFRSKGGSGHADQITFSVGL
jgi:hypothetical protein